MYKFQEKDWKLFRKKLPGWQEDYMGKLCHIYIDILSKDANPSSRFWELSDRMKKDKRNPGVIIDDMSRSQMWGHILELYDFGVITMDDLSEFSDSLKKTIAFLRPQDE